MENERCGQRKIRRPIIWDKCRHLNEKMILRKLALANMSAAARVLLYKVALRTLLRASSHCELAVADSFFGI